MAATKKQEGRKDPKEYMKLAVQVMKKSIPERKKKNPSPYVGAVLVFPDGTVETAYRGELREEIMQNILCWTKRIDKKA